MNRFLVALALVLASGSAWADGDDALNIRVEGYGSWPQAVASLQADTGAEGRSVLVTVTARAGDVAPCGSYTLSLDDVASRAFSVGACDPRSGATTLRLVHRSALFSHDDVVPTPLVAGVSAVQVLQGGAAGGASNVGGSELECSVSVRPFLTDLEHGTRVYLTPGRFVLRSVAAGVTVSSGTNGWTLHGAPQGGLTVDYEVFDTQRETVVVHDRATLQCQAQPIAATSATARTIVQSDPIADSAVPAVRLVLPTLAAPRPRPIASLYGSIEIGSVGYLGLEHLALHNGNVNAHGGDLALHDTWMAGSAGFGVIAELPYLMVAARAHAAFSDSVALIEARGTVAVGVPIHDAFVYAGGEVQLWRAWVGAEQGTWDTGTVTSYGIETGVRFHTRTRWNPTLGRFQLGETALSLTVPISDAGAVFVTWEGAWGTGR